LDTELIRFFLLFWDKLDWPENSFISIGGPDDHVQFLIDTGVIMRSRASGSIKGNGAEILKFCHVGAFNELDKKYPGQWSLAKGEGSISFDDSNLEQGRGVLVELHHAIPVPSADVPFQEILEFKLKRQDELLQLRAHLEDLYQAIISAPDMMLAKSTQLQRLDRAIAEHVKAISETGFNLRISGLCANLNVERSLVGLLASIASAANDLSLANAALNGIAATLSLSVGAELRNHRISSTPFEYVGSMHRQFPVRG
jgi:hypothetical protein